MSVKDWQLLKDVEKAVAGVAGIRTALTTVCDSSVEVPASGFPAGLVMWKETREKLSGTEAGELAGRVLFVIAVVVREGEAARAMEEALKLANDARDAVLADPSRGGLASATEDGAATEVGTAEMVSERKPPLAEVRLTGSCGYYVSRRG